MKKIVVLVLAMALAGYAQEKGEKKTKAPQAVMDAFKKAYPNAQIKNVSSEKEGGKIIYDVESVDGTQRRDLLYSADGKVLETEEAIPNAQIPKTVVDAVAAKYPKAPIVSAEKLTKTGESMIYELVIKVAGKNKEVQVDPSGKIK